MFGFQNAHDFGLQAPIMHLGSFLKVSFMEAEVQGDVFPLKVGNIHRRRHFQEHAGLGEVFRFPADNPSPDRDGDVYLDLIALPGKFRVLRARLSLMVVAAAGVAALAARVRHVGKESAILGLVKQKIRLCSRLFFFLFHTG